ncbi:hypothetical protein ATG70_3169 [Bacillus sp. es.036]|nr:hypothetical protein ATG70_3169 [Bacillus sp. es.036]
MYVLVFKIVGSLWREKRKQVGRVMENESFAQEYLSRNSTYLMEVET